MKVEKNEIKPFAVIETDLEIMILSEMSEKDKVHDITYMWNLRK